MAIYQPVPLYFDLSAGQTATSWYKMLSPSTNHERGIHGTITSGDSIQVQMTNEKLVAENNILTTDVSTSSYAASPLVTSTVFDMSYVGAYRWVRIVKTGSNGVARVVVEC